MHAMVLHRPGQPLVRETRPLPAPGPGQVRLRVLACAVCRTDLHVVDGELPHPALPLVPGHEIVGEVDATGPGVHGLHPGQRVGVGWLGHACGHCDYCAADRENLCDAPGFTGYTRDGGFATHAIADFAQALRAIGEPLQGRKARDISMARVLGQLFATTEMFDFREEGRPPVALERSPARIGPSRVRAGIGRRSSSKRRTACSRPATPIGAAATPRARARSVGPVARRCGD